MTITLPFTTLDVFTSHPFTGNPLAIVTIPPSTTLPQSTKQAIAREFNFSETVFLHAPDDAAPAGRRLDIFTTAEELPFAGHPTIGTVFAIGSRAQWPAGQDTAAVTLRVKAGTIHAEYDYRTAVAAASIPHKVHVHGVHGVQVSRGAVLASQPGLQAAMDAAGEHGPFPLVSPVTGIQFVLVKVPTEPECLSRVARSQLPVHRVEEGAGFVAPYFYAVEGEREGVLRIRTRMVEPDIGEDPATGAAACALTCYLSLKEGGEGRSFEYEITQGVEMGRRSVIGVKVVLDESGKGVGKVTISGTAVVVTQGTMEI